LLQDMFGCAAALQAQGRMIRGRLIFWDGGHGKPDHVEEPGLTIASGNLNRILRDASRADCDGSRPCISESRKDGSDRDPSWTIEARGRAADGTGDVVTIGERVAICGHARLSDAADLSVCAVEAVRGGWLFLLPLDGRRAAVQAVVPRAPKSVDAIPDTLLGQSRLVGRLVAELDGDIQVFSCAPRFRLEPARSAWLAAGESALSFDPLCGDGTGQALRCGLLAAAVIAAIVQGEPQQDCLAHYRDRLRRAMLAHLKATIDYYEIAPCHDLWRRDNEMAHQALDDIAHGASAMRGAKDPRYQLQRLSLVRA
jgi:hypothetical protein